jgi:hypothetical protein
VQQSAPELQERPLVLQVPHLPLRHWYPLQQSPLEAQVEPDPAQGLAQVPPLHSSPPQHSLEYVQVLPAELQHLPLSQLRPEQHWLAVEHELPGVLQALQVP